jgi:hypothetical protein
LVPRSWKKYKLMIYIRSKHVETSLR